MHLYNDRIAKVRPGAACSKWLYSKRLGCDGEVQLGCMQSPPMLSAAYKLHCSIVETTESVEKILLECQLVILYGAQITAEL